MFVGVGDGGVWLDFVVDVECGFVGGGVGYCVLVVVLLVVV